MSTATVRASTSGYKLTSGGATQSVTIPGTPVAGDPIGLWLTGQDATKTLTTPTGWTLIYTNVALGTGTRFFYKKIWTAGDSTSVSLAFSGPAAYSYGVLVMDGSVHTDFGALGTITTRGASSTTSTAVATGSSSTPNLVIFHEKTTSQTSCVVTPTETDIVNQMPASGAAGSLYIGTYDDSAGTADRTATYGLAANTNGCGYQIPVGLAVAPAGGTATISITASVNVGTTAAATGSATLGLSASGSTVGPVAATGSATLTLSASGAASVPVAVTGSANLTLTASGLAQGGDLAVWLSRGTARFAAHRDGFYGSPWNLGEFTVAGFNALKAYSTDVARNIDVFKTSDGEWVASHDQTTGRVLSGTSLDIPTSTWASISAKTTLIGGNPVARIDDIVAVAPAGTIFFVDNKANNNTSAFFAKLTSLGLNPTNTVNKNFIGSTAMLTAAQAAGYTTWGYGFDGDMASFASNHAKATWLGFDYAGTQANWNTIIGYAQPSFAHILGTLADKTSADSKASVAGGSNFGYMVSGVSAVVPHAAIGSATLTMSATSDAASAATGSASLSLTAAVSSSIAVTGSTSMSLSAVGTSRAPIVGVASLLITATVGGSVISVVGTASIGLNASGGAIGITSVTGIASLSLFTTTGSAKAPAGGVAFLSITTTGVASDGTRIDSHSSHVLARTIPYIAPARQTFADNTLQSSHEESLYLFGELCVFTMMWRPADFDLGLVEHCHRCFGSGIGEPTRAQRQAAAYDQPTLRKCPDCFGTTFEGGFRAQIIRPALLADRNSEVSDGERGTVTTDSINFETTSDFQFHKGDYLFRFDGTRYQVDEKNEVVVRTGFGPVRRNENFAGQSVAHLEMLTAVAYDIPFSLESDDRLSRTGFTTFDGFEPVDLFRPNGYLYSVGER